jgi:ATP-dependent protease ClpP protease subunit
VVELPVLRNAGLRAVWLRLQHQSVKPRASFLFALVFAALFNGGCTIQLFDSNDVWRAKTQSPVDFADPVLNRRQILLFGDIDEKAAERTIQKLLFLEGKGHEPIDLYLMTPGGEFKSAFAIEHVMRSIKSLVNTYALSECNSGGAVLLAAGTGRRKAFRGATVIVHGMKVRGKPPVELTRQIQDGYTRFWRERARLPESWLPLPPDILHVLSAEQALEYRIVDEIIER